MNKTYTIDLQGKHITLEICPWAEQANASILATIGETVVLTTAVMSNNNSSANYFPLNVEYRENYYASGIIGGGSYRKREGRPSDEAILKARLVDRSLRPLFNQHIRRDIQIVNSVLSYDSENTPDVLALIASATALFISDIPFNGPLGAVRVAEVNGQFVVSPTKQELEQASFAVLVAGGAGTINMLEIEGNNTPEQNIVQAIQVAQQHIDAVIQIQQHIQQEVGKQKQEVELHEAPQEVKDVVRQFAFEKLQSAIFTPSKQEHEQAIYDVQEQVGEMLKQTYEDEGVIQQGVEFVDELVNDIVHSAVLEQEKRVDGRGCDQIRALSASVRALPRTHGSGVFMRGLTHILSTATLAIIGNEELHDDMEGRSEKRFMHHYNFPPYSVGETGMFRGPGRREVGHGALAEKALRPIIPDEKEFPYVVRVVSEVLSSNGSSSMGSVCGASLALFDAGVPIKDHIAGIAMGLITNKDQSAYKILTDIQGPEDHYGDMDLKVAGTKHGVNAVQMDVKLEGISLEMLQNALQQAQKARLEILGVLESAIPTPRESVSQFVPIVKMLDVNPDKIGYIIGSGGSTIKDIQATTETEITIKEDGRVIVGGYDKEKLEAAVQRIKQLGHEVKQGDCYMAKVVKIADFGAFVEILPNTEVLVHISEIQNEFIKDVSTVLKVGDKKPVKILKVDDQTGKISASIKAIKGDEEVLNFLG